MLFFYLLQKIYIVVSFFYTFSRLSYKNFQFKLTSETYSVANRAGFVQQNMGKKMPTSVK
jgi:hypothetical protein